LTDIGEATDTKPLNATEAAAPTATNRNVRIEPRPIDNVNNPTMFLSRTHDPNDPEPQRSQTVGQIEC
jgi:hypothetical protein